MRGKMLRISRSVVIAVLLFFLLSVTSFAKSDTAYTVSSDIAEEKWNEFLEIVPEGSISFDGDGDVLSGVGIDALLHELINAFRGSLGGAFSFLMLTFGVCILLLAADSLSEIGGGFGEHVTAGVSLISSLLIFFGIRSLIASVKNGLLTLSSFFAALIPVITGVSAAGGAANTAAAEAFNMNLTLTIVERASTLLLLPLALSLFALSLISGIESRGVSSVAGSLRGAFMWILGIGAAVVIGAVSMQSVIAGAKDSAYLRAAKYAASGMIPVVGSTVSQALATLAGGLSFVKSTVGIASVMIILSIALSPLVSLVLYRAAISFGISFLQIAGSGGGVRMFSAFKTALDTLIAVYSMSTTIYISEIIVFVKSGVGTFA